MIKPSAAPARGKTIGVAVPSDPTSAPPDIAPTNDSRFTNTVIDIGVVAPCSGNWKNFQRRWRKTGYFSKGL